MLNRPIGYPGSIDPAVPTMGTLLANEGYATGLAGKWHLAAELSEPNESWPTRRGFADFYGILSGCANYFQPKTFLSGEENAEADADDPDFYLTDAVTDHAVRFVTEAHSRDQPFLLYLAYTAPHWPLHAPEDDVAGQQGRYTVGWDVLRAERAKRQDELGLFAQPFPAAPRDPVELAWDDTPDHAWEERRMEVYAAQVAAMDRGVGRVMTTLDELDIADETLVLFFSDNGACAETIEPGQTMRPTICPPTTRDGRPVAVGNDPAVAPGGEDTYATYGRAWANLSNTPFRLYKRWVHEGGIASPLIASWPGGGVSGGTVVDRPGHVVDVLPTLLEAVAATAAPKGLAGRSLLGTLQGDDLDGERTLYWEHIGNCALREGSWKLVREQGQPWELYDLSTDRAELHDLAVARPDLVSRLAGQWDTWARDHGVRPWDEIVALYQERGMTKRDAAN